MKKILVNILGSIEQIDVRAAVGKAIQNNSDPLKEKHYLITVVEEVIKKAKMLGYDFCSKDGFIYVFNSQYWGQIFERDIKSFLKNAGYRMGLDKYQAKHYLFVDNLTKQFYSSLSSLQIIDEDNIKINLLNGTFEFGLTFKLRNFEKQDFLTYQLPFEYCADATAPIFKKYLTRVLPYKCTQDILAEYIGYVFSGNFKQQKCMLLFGSGANGKSVFFEIVSALLGKENITSFSLANLDNENSRALISNKLLNYSSEINANINKDTFKQLCSGEPLQARLKYKDSFMMTKYAKLIFNCNDLPRDVENTDAYFRRLLLIPFSQTIPLEEQDRDLASKIIQNELSGVFNWVLEGLKRLEIQGTFTESEHVNKLLKEYREDSNSVLQFLNGSGYEKIDECKIPLTFLYREYDQFCKDNGCRSVNMANFRRRLEGENVFIKRISSGNFVGLARHPNEDIKDNTELF